ncbi:MAG: glucose-1-phosphate thymidylyltransferase [Candidatus Anstonellales archaeon]
MKGVILAGGKGTRLRPLTHSGAKQLIPVATKPIIYSAIEDLVSAGITDIGIIVGHSPERIQSIKDGIGDESKFGARITYIEQEAPLGLAHAVLCAKDFVSDDPFVVYLGDNMLENGISPFVKAFENSDSDASILITPVQEPELYGIAYLNSNGNLIRVEEKPKNPSSNMAIIGVYFFTKSIFEVIPRIKPSKRGELEITDAIQELIMAGKKVTSYIVDGWWDDTGTPKSILLVNSKVLESDKIKSKNEGDVDKEAIIEGKVSIGKGTRIGPGCIIKGPTVIGENCHIHNAKIGPYVSIGNACRIENAKLSWSLILDGVELVTNITFIDTIVGKHTRIVSRSKSPHQPAQVIIGENSTIIL